MVTWILIIALTGQPTEYIGPYKTEAACRQDIRYHQKAELATYTCKLQAPPMTYPSGRLDESPRMSSETGETEGWMIVYPGGFRRDPELWGCNWECPILTVM